MEKRLLKTSSLYVLLGFLAPAVNFFLVPVYTHYLAKSDYALITLAMLVQTIFTPLLNLGMVSAFSRYFYDHITDRKAVDTLFSTTLVFLLLVTVCFAIISFVIGPWAFNFFFKNDVFTFNKYGYYVLATAFAMNAQILTLTYYRNYELFRSYALWSILFFVTSAAAIYIGVAVLHKEAAGSIAGRMWGTTTILVPLFFFFFKFRPIRFDWRLCKSMLPYALPLVPYLLLNVAFSNFDKALVERNFSLSQLGEYGFAILIASVIDIILNSVQSAIYPQLFRLMAEVAQPEAGERVRHLFQMTIVLNALTIAALISFTGIGLYLFIDSRYWSIMHYFPLLCLVYVPRLVFTIWGVPMMYYKRTKYLPLSNGISLVLGIVAGLLLIRHIGIYALPVALFLVQATHASITFFLNRKLKIHLHVFNRLHREYGLLLLLLTTGLVANYVYERWIPNVYVYVPVFFFVANAVIWLYFNTIKKMVLGRFKRV